MITYRSDGTGIRPDQLHGFFVGWPQHPTPETLLRLLQQSYARVIAVDGETGRVVGFITAISDGVLSAYIPLLEVLPDYQHQGIGRELVARLMADLSGIYMVDLVCDEGVAPFYDRLGWHRGIAMMHRDYDNQTGR